MSGLTAFLAARLDEDTDDIEASIAGELESLHADGVDSTRDELLTPIPGEYEPDLPRRLREVEAKLKERGLSLGMRIPPRRS